MLFLGVAFGISPGACEKRHVCVCLGTGRLTSRCSSPVDKARVPSRIASGRVGVPGPSQELFVSLCCGGNSEEITAVASSAGLGE